MTTADNTLAGARVYGHGAVSIGLKKIDACWRQKKIRDGVSSSTGVLVLQSPLDISFSVQRVILHDSVNTSEGSVYHEVETFTLAG